MNKRWVDTEMKYDPLYLWTNKRARFDKFVQRAMNKAQGDSDDDSEEEVRKVKAKKEKVKQIKKAQAAAPAP